MRIEVFKHTSDLWVLPGVEDLESVLNEKGERLNKDYLELLYLEVESALSKTEASPVGYGAYGSVWISIEYTDAGGFEYYSKLVDMAVGKWAKKYRIANLKDGKSP